MKLAPLHGSHSGAFFDPAVFGGNVLPAEALEITAGKQQAQAWAALLRARVATVHYVLQRDLDVLFVDADVVFNRDVVPELQAATESLDALFMWDGPTSGRQYPARGEAPPFPFEARSQRWEVNTGCNGKDTRMSLPTARRSAVVRGGGLRLFAVGLRTEILCRASRRVGGKMVCGEEGAWLLCMGEGRGGGLSRG